MVRIVHALVEYNFGHDFYNKMYDIFDNELIGRNVKRMIFQTHTYQT